MAAEEQESNDLVWTPEGTKAFEKAVPVFARKMARNGLEKYCRENGIKEITEEVIAEAKKLAGK